MQRTHAQKKRKTNKPKPNENKTGVISWVCLVSLTSQLLKVKCGVMWPCPPGGDPARLEEMPEAVSYTQ